MVRLDSLSPAVFEKYGLLDEAKIRKVIEANDMVVHQSREVSRLPTPREVYGKTLREHYDLHDGTITLDSDLDLMMSIIDKHYPEVAPYAHDYMEGGHYLGYNMFIMKKPLFDGMCSFLFGVLDVADPNIDMTYRSQNGRRIHGYLAELLTSIYIYYLRTTQPELKVDERQMLFGERTDPVPNPKPIKDAVPVVFDLASHDAGNAAVLFPVGFQTFLNTVDTKKQYDVLIVHRALPAFFQKHLARQAASIKNVTLRFIDYTVEMDIVKELSGVQAPSFPVLAPWVLSNYNTVLLLQWNTLVRADIAAYTNIKLPSGTVLAAAQDVYFAGQVNEQDSLAKKRAEQFGLDPYAVVDGGVLLMDLAYRRKHEDELTTVTDVYKSDMHDTEWLNKRYADALEVLPQEWNTRIITDDGMAHICALAPGDLFKEFQGATKSGVVAQYLSTAPLQLKPTDFTIEYWSVACKLDIYPLISDAAASYNKRSGRGIRDIIAPVGSKRRHLIKRAFPKGSAQRRLFGKVKRSTLG